MKTSLLASVLLAAATSVAAAAADGGGLLSVSQGWDGVVSPSGTVRYVALPAGKQTIVEKILVKSGRVLAWRNVQDGGYGFPYVTQDGATGGVSRDGKQLVLSTSPGGAVSRFRVLNAKTLKPLQAIVLRGVFGYDALSPDGSTLYLIQHTSSRNLARYRVRAYDVAARRLLPQAIADKRESVGSMTGYPMSRVTTADGAWVYTLYSRAQGPSFIHALDTIHRTAVCLDLRLSAGQDVRLSLGPDERQILLLQRQGGARVEAVAAPR